MKSTMITGLTNDQEYGFRVFPRNPQGQLQTRNDRGTILATPKAGIPLANLAEGAVVMIPEGEVPTAFYLAKHSYEAELNGAGRELMVRKDCYDMRKWNNSNVNAYAASSIDTWSNGDYKALFDTNIQAAMGTTKFYYTLMTEEPIVTTLQRAVFTLSLGELGRTTIYAKKEGTELPISSVLRIAPAGGTGGQWTRTPYFLNFYNVFRLDSQGQVGQSGASYAQCSSRPAFTLPSDLVVGPVPNTDGSYNLVL